MDPPEQVRTRLLQLIGGKRFDTLRDLFRAAKPDGRSDLRLQDLCKSDRSGETTLRRGLAGRSLAIQYQYQRLCARKKGKSNREM